MPVKPTEQEDEYFARLEFDRWRKALDEEHRRTKALLREHSSAEVPPKPWSGLSPPAPYCPPAVQDRYRLAGQLILNRYTQSEEYAADRHGADILQKAGHPGREMMADTLTWLMQTEGDSGGGFFATPPGTAERIQALRAGR